MTGTKDGSRLCYGGWGLGINTHKNGEASYGFPESDDPTKFYPDREMTTDDEYRNWSLAVRSWKAAKKM